MKKHLEDISIIVMLKGDLRTQKVQVLMGVLVADSSRMASTKIQSSIISPIPMQLFMKCPRTT